jgi:hypothetical protein
MSSTALLDQLGGAGAPPLLGLRVLLRRDALDRTLADGARPGDTLALALRARQLATRREAEQVAERLEAILHELDRPPARALTARAPLQRAQIVAARPFVANLVQRLRDVEHPHAAGIARARQLIVDGASPLYSPSHPGALARLAWRAADAL